MIAMTDELMEINRTSETLEQLDLSKIDEFTVEGSDNLKLADNSRKSYKNDVRGFNQWLEDNDRTVTEDSLGDYFEELKESCSAATLNRKRCAIIRALRAHYDGNSALQVTVEQAAKQATESYKVERQVDGDDIPTVGEVQELIDLCKEDGKDDLALIIRFLWTTAVRISELCNIRLRDIEEKQKRVKIKIRGKGNKERTVKITYDLYDSIRDEFEGEKFLFENRNGNPFGRSNIYKRLDRLDTNIPRNPHSFRHSRSENLIQNGFSLKSVSRYLGHSSTSITADLYIHDTVDYDELEEKNPLN